MPRLRCQSAFEKLSSHNRASLKDDLQIQHEGQIPQIEQIHGDHFVESRLVFPVHLPVSCETRETVYAFPLPWLVMGKFIWRAWPRTNQTHFAAQHVENLR